MTQNDHHFDEFQPHTKLKHAILDTYIISWAMKLLMGGAGSTLAIVDAFAGQGRDQAGNPGSPVIAARRALEAMAAARGKTPCLHDPKVHVIAIEKKASYHDTLVEVMEPFVRQHPDLIAVHRGELADHIDEILHTTSVAPTFYFLDPFGVKGLDAGTYAKALAGAHNEIFALFADIGATRLHGLITAERADPTDEVERILSPPSLFPEEDSTRIAAAEAAAARANDALDLSIPASRRHLTRALGSEEWVASLECTAAEDRPDAFLRLFCRALIAAGAQYVVTIPMRNDDGHRVYSLVHASKSKAGFATMKEAVCSGLKKTDIGDEARQRLITDLSIDVATLVAALRQALAGRQRPWADQGAIVGIKTLVLQHTAMFPLQYAELKTSLKDAGILRRIDRKEICVFPPLS